MFQSVELDVEVAKKKTPIGDQKRQHQKRSPHQSQPSIRFLLVIFATACGCVYAYHIALRIHRLEQRVELMSHVGCGGSNAVTSRPTTDRHRQTNATSNSSTTTTTLSSADTSPTIKDQVWTDDRSKQYFDIDDEMYHYDYFYPDYDEDTEEASGDDSRHESYDGRQSHELLRNRSYAGRRHRRSADEVRTSDEGASSSPRRRRQHLNQQHTGHRRWRRTTSPASTRPVSARHQARNSRDERRRDRTESVRRRRPHGG